MTKVRQAERALGRVDGAEKPFEPWELQLGLRAGTRAGTLVTRLTGAVVRRGDFTLGPLDVDLVPGERLAVTGRAGWVPTDGVVRDRVEIAYAERGRPMPVIAGGTANE